ncbi:MAG: hypothetical protein US62_C0006G0019 [Candidatus Woesebacteria bacterium GW2011_GWA1_37_8]|uniref:Uncharacterized protein n=1 Tax=Candidatus Woesebacteria bacterium GW2011_GWA1_37_8 TaxID=1618546 RepID=A0A0G0HS70_9BACT|nr:MAG: hypothetical protein US39_C0004G0043 [Microgenomates group bacterium GW2011_GWC1_37_12b]KKQ46008.1 MAG: hypothetical protein US62_C0006G0019 [Candidatus Woesebacteria bacterium GW2011_GWA1_37_8]
MKIRKILLFILSLMFSATAIWVLLRTIAPITPRKIDTKFNLCSLDNITSWSIPQGNQPTSIYSIKSLKETKIVFSFDKVSERIILICKTSIPVDVLYKAKSLNLNINSNQKLTITAEIQRHGQGAELHNLIIDKSSDDNPQIISSELGKIRPKINWLTGDYDSVIFYLSPSNIESNLNLIIYGIFLN